MRQYIRHQMTEEQLACFLAANGLRPDVNQLLAPQGESVGMIDRAGEGSRMILIVEEKRRCDGGDLTAWWPVSRLAWTLITSDGEVEVGDVLGPDEVICDLCNAEVANPLVPVLNGYAHCAACFAGLGVAFPGRVHPFRQAHRHEYSRWQGRPYCVLSSEENNP